jgi:LacI family transcriptional regulator
MREHLPRASGTGRSRDTTIRDVAAKAGVSIGTVSRFLNGYALKEDTRARVARAVDKLGYRQNVIAKGMKTRRTYSIGVLFPIFDEFHTEILSALERFFSQRGYHMVVCQYEHDEHAMGEKLVFLRQRFADGLILSPAGTGLNPEIARECHRLIESGIPVITFNNRIAALACDHVHVNDAQAVRDALAYLFRMKHRDVAIIAGVEAYSTARERVAGYTEAMEAIGIPEARRVVLSGPWSDSTVGYQLGKEMMALPRRPSAVFSSNGILTTGLLEYLSESGFRIPEDISLVSFDDPQLFRLHKPGITAVRQPLEDIAKAVSDLMIRRLAGDWSRFPTDQRLTTELVLRASVRERRVAAPIPGQGRQQPPGS